MIGKDSVSSFFLTGGERGEMASVSRRACKKMSKKKEDQDQHKNIVN